MSLTVAEVLDLEVFRRANPEVLAGEARLDAVVRWVHSSEVAEIAPLLKGGELLLTTGLGLARASSGARRRYVEEVAEAGIAGLAVELGRTFATVPPDMVAAARSCTLPLVALRTVVPFVEMTEEVHLHLVDRAAAELRRGDEIARALNDALLSESGLHGLVALVARLAGAPALVATAGGAVVATAGFGETEDAARHLDRPALRAPVVVHGQRWGNLHIVDPPPGTGDVAALVLERAPVAIALELLRTRGLSSALDRTRRELVEDMVADRATTNGELVVRAAVAGFHPPAGSSLVGIALALAGPDAAVGTLDAALATCGTSVLRAVLEGDALAIVVARGPDDGPRLAARVLRELDRLGAAQVQDGPTLAVGPPATDLLGAARSLRESRRTLELARRLALPSRLVTAAGLAVDRLVARMLADPELPMIVEEQLGTLMAHDAARGSDLVGTLAAYLAHGGAKATTARALGVRRQSLYARLARIEELVGGPLGDPERQTALLIALKARAQLTRG